MKLIIAEKPSVANAIIPVVGADSRYNGYAQGNGYIVSWCYGHLVSMLTPDAYCDEWAQTWNFAQLPMIPQRWRFKVSENCKEQFSLLKGFLNSDDISEVICATDADREGECIFRYVYHLSKCSKPVRRLWISSLEESAISDGIRNAKPMSDYDNLFAAGFCRAKADWLVGMNASRLFSIRYRAHLNSGRVQTPTLAMIVRRDNDVDNFVAQKFYKAELSCGGFTAATERIDDEIKADEIVALCNGKSAVVTEVVKERKRANPPKLFDLTSLQREANKLFGYTAQQTLDLQQSLYEKKLSTYPRTDSEYITEDMKESVKSLIVNLRSMDFPFVKENRPFDISRCVNGKKVASHPAILPTEKVTQDAFSKLSQDEKNILALEIARLFTATNVPHEYEAVKASLMCENILFFATGKAVVNDGFKSTEKLFRASLKAKSDEKKDDENALPDIKKGQTFDNVEVTRSEHLTSPPKPYTEDTLLTAMEHAGQEEYDENTEKKGLGTPATRAATIENLVRNGYIMRKGKQLRATDKGVKLIQAVPNEVKSAKLTAEWEMKLKQVEQGKYSAEEFINGIVAFVSEICAKYAEFDKNISFNGGTVLGQCPKCKSDVKKGKYGFYCSEKCGMNVAKVYGKVLTENQLKRLLDGKEISYTAKGIKVTVLPSFEESGEYNGKTYFQWKMQACPKAH